MEKPQKFRRKPFEIEAIHYDGKNITEVKSFCNCHSSILQNGTIVLAVGDDFIVVLCGDWVARYPKGDYQSMSPETFEEMYEPC